jgi:hypothetical protein
VSIEDRIRAATESTAATVTEIRPLTLPDDPAPARGRRFRSQGAGRAWGGWLTPLAAAVAVIAVAATLVAVRGLSGAAPGPRSTSSTASLPVGVPRYYVGLTSTGTNRVGGQIDSAFVADVSTGKQLAAVMPPSDATFTAVEGAADDRTFVLSGAEGSALGPGGDKAEPETAATTIWYLLRLTPGAAHLDQLTRLSIPSYKGETMDTFAVSPDGKTLAIVSQTPRAAHYQAMLRTYSLATGRLLRTWTTPLVSTALNEINSITNLLWLDDGRTLSFLYQPVDNNGVDLRIIPRYFRTLNTASPGTDFFAESKTVYSVPPTGHACDSDAVMTADGKSVICDSFAPNSGWCATGQLALTAYSVATGKLERVVYRYPTSCSIGYINVLWAESAALVIALTTVSTPPSPTPDLPPLTNLVGVITPGKYIPLSVRVAGATYEAPGIVAF